MTLNDLCRVRHSDINLVEPRLSRLIVLRDTMALYDCDEELNVTGKTPVKSVDLTDGFDSALTRVRVWAAKHNYSIINHVYAN